MRFSRTFLRIIAPAALAAGLFSSGHAHAEQAKAVIELFTSQGCSSCPKADRLASEMAAEAGIVVLTFPVDYWDYLGWKDTLGSAAHSARQRAYALVRGDRKVFTPQVVINGLSYAVGSDRAAIHAAIGQTARRDVLTVPVGLHEAGGQIDVELPDHGGVSPSEVWLIAFASSRTVAIARGENADRTVTYTNVVRRMTRLGGWSGKAAHFMVPRAEAVPADADRYVVLVQEGSGSMPGAVLGVQQAAY